MTMTNMTTSDAGITAISLREGNILHAYKDSVGVWTIGVGHTSAAGAPHVTPGMKISRPESLQILKTDLRDCEHHINDLVSVPLTQNQFDALVSFVFNIGWPTFAKSTILRKVNEKDYHGAAEAFDLYHKPPEIKGRRDSEKAQFLRA
jgi:lysozyme